MVFVLLVIILIVLFFTYIFTMHINWDVHKDMVRSSTEFYDKAGYKRFVEEFNKVDWLPNLYFKGSLQSKDSKNKYHASIIMFNGKGMIVNNPVSYFRVVRYVNRYIEKEFGVWHTKEWR